MNDEIEDLLKEVRESNKNQKPAEGKSEDKVDDKKEEKSNKTFIERLKENGFDVANEDDALSSILALKNSSVDNTTKDGEIVQIKNDLERYKSMVEGFDPLQHFSSVESYKREQLKKQFPELSIEVAEKIVSADLSKLSPENKIAIGLKIKHPDLTDTEIKSLITERYGDDEDRSDAKKAQMKLDASDSASEILKLRSTVKEPEKIDLKSQKEKQDKEASDLAVKIEQDWTRESDKVLFDKFDITDTVDGKETTLLSMNVEDDFKKELKKEIVEFFKGSKIQVTPESIEYAKREALEIYRRKNYVKTLKLYAKQEVEKAKAEWEKENAGMGGHVSRSADGSKAANQFTDKDVERMVYGTKGDSPIKPVNYNR